MAAPCKLGLDCLHGLAVLKLLSTPHRGCCASAGVRPRWARHLWRCRDGSHHRACHHGCHDIESTQDADLMLDIESRCQHGAKQCKTGVQSTKILTIVLLV